MRIQPILITLMALAMSAQTALAQEAEKLVLKMYPISDIVLKVADYPYPGEEASRFSNFGGGMGGGGFGGGGGFQGGGAFQVGGDLREEPYSTTLTVDDLVEAIHSFVDPDSWDDEAELKVLGGALVVRQTPENHGRIAEFLTEIRNSLGNRRTVSIDARWLMLTSVELDELVAEGEAKSNPLAVDREKLTARMLEPTSLRAIGHCFSGQRTYLVSGSRQNIVSGFIPVVGSIETGAEGLAWDHTPADPTLHFVSGIGPAALSSGGRSVGYQPIVERPNLGVLLEIRPTLEGGAEQGAIVDLKSTLSAAGTTPKINLDEEVQWIAPQVDRIAITRAELATTLRLPLGVPVVVGGLTLNPAEVGEEGEPSKQVYLILEVR